MLCNTFGKQIEASSCANSTDNLYELRYTQCSESDCQKGYCL